MMDIHQTIKLWASLSPRILRGDSVNTSIKEGNQTSQKPADVPAPPEEAQPSTNSVE